jgi:hypothetical protein
MPYSTTASSLGCARTPAIMMSMVEASLGCEWHVKVKKPEINPTYKYWRAALTEGPTAMDAAIPCLRRAD